MLTPTRTALATDKVRYVGDAVAAVIAESVSAAKDAAGYIRESIIDPQAKIVTGFGPVMPTFRGQVTDQELSEVIAYIESLK